MRQFFQQYFLNCLPILGLYKRTVKEWEKRYFSRKCPNGAVILTYNPTSWGNIFIRGHWKHAAIFIDCKFHEATTHGTKRTGIIEFLETKKDYKVLFPNFLTDRGGSMTLFLNYIREKTRESIEYDWFFHLGKKKLYCSELVYLGFKAATGDRNPYKNFGRIISPTELDNGVMIDIATVKVKRCSK